jgi:hypothetical protein
MISSLGEGLAAQWSLLTTGRRSGTDTEQVIRHLYPTNVTVSVIAVTEVCVAVQTASRHAGPPLGTLTCVTRLLPYVADN